MTRGLNLKLLVAVAVIGAAGAPAHAIHRHTPEVVRITQTGDYTLPRLPTFGHTLLVSNGAPGSRTIYGLRVHDLDQGMSLQPLSDGGDNTNPVGGRGTRLMAWDTTQSPIPSEHGRQVELRTKVSAFPSFFNDPSGTSSNPSVSRKASAIAWESRGNLTDENPSGASQIFFVSRSDPSPRQLSRGLGDSRNAALGGTDSLVAFDSTSDGTTGANTGISQIWLADLDTGLSSAITNGKAASEFPSMSQDSRVIVFQSRAALDTDGHEMTVPQVFARDTYGETFARVTSHPAGCTLPSVRAAKGDFRIAYMCGGKAYFSELRSGRQYVLPIPMGDTTRVVSELGNFFLVLSTTADLTSSTNGVTNGHQLYLWNLYKRPALPVPSALTWFPRKGLSQL